MDARCYYYHFLLVLFCFLQYGTSETFHWGVIDENDLSLYILGSVFPLNCFVFISAARYSKKLVEGYP